MGILTKLLSLFHDPGPVITLTGSVSTAVRINYAAELKKAGRLDDAANVLWAIVEADPNEIAARVNLADIWIDQGKYGDAILVLQVMVSKVPDCSAAWCNLSSALSHVGDHERALNAANEAVKADVNNAMAYYNRAECWWQEDQFDLAFQDYQIAMRLAPQNQEIRDHYDLALLSLNRINLYAQSKHEPKEHGAVLVDGIQVASTIQCPHCDMHFDSIIGTAVNWCGHCGSRTCDQPACMAACRPYLKVLEAAEKDAQRM